MKRNRKMSRKMSVITAVSMRLGALIVLGVVVAILNLLASSSCKQLTSSIGDKSRMLARMENERQRESLRWEEMKQLDKLESALVNRGLSMHYPRPEQVIKMRGDGTPRPGQLSVARVKQRSAAAATAQYRVRVRRR